MKNPRCRCGETDPDKFYLLKIGRLAGRYSGKCKSCKTADSTDPEARQMRSVREANELMRMWRAAT